MKTQIFVPKQIPDEFDVIVVGGGLAGTFAAVAAAREGKKVLLLEKHNCLGGMATCGLIFPFMKDDEGESHRPANAGLYGQMKRELYEMGESVSPTSRQYKEEFMKVLLDRMVRKAGVKVLFRSQMYDVERDGDTIRSVTVATVSGNITVRGKIFIDASGDADLCAFAGLPFEQGRESDGLCQPMTLCFRLANVDWSKYDAAAANELYRKMQLTGEIKNPREDLLLFRYPVENILHANTTRVFGKNPVDVEDLTETDMELREQMIEMYHFLKEHIPGMEHCELISSALDGEVRESRRIVGRKRIEAEDLLNTVKFEDSIARGTYCIDIHNPSGSGTVLKHIPNNDYYTIPYGALLPEGMKNLIDVGRSISTSHEALSAVRIMPITSCMGEAAGIAAAMALDAGCGVADVDMTALRGKIVAYGGLC